MIEPAEPPDEARRLKALRALHILDTPPEERYDRITRLAAELFDVPISVISMIDADRQWFKSHHGLTVGETPRSVSFCGHTILQPGVFHVADAALDERFADNPLVAGEPHVRFYAGVPLRASGGEPIGTLCLIDTRPHELTEADRTLLGEFARWAQDALALTERMNSPWERLRPWTGVLVTAMVVALFEFLLSSPHYIPNPPAILVIAVVFAASYSGLAAGLASALIACVYIAHFFSIPGQAFHYVGDNLSRVLIWAAATPAIVVMTGLLNRRSRRLLVEKIGTAVTSSYLAEVAAKNSELRKSHERMRLVTESVPVHMAFYDKDIRCRYVNESYAKWLGLNAKHMLGRELSEILATQGISDADFTSVHARVFAGERVEREREHRHPDGRVSHLKVILVPQFSETGQTTGFYTFTSDITELKNATLEMARARERLSLAIEGSNLCLWDWDMQQGTVFLDSTWARMLGEEPHDTVLSAGELFDLVHPDDQEKLYDQWQLVLKGGQEFYVVEHRVRTRGGEWLWIASLGKVVERNNGNMALRMTGTNADITERKKAEARIKLLATTDPLTSLPNRRMLSDRISHAMLNVDRDSGALFALLFIDLDHFKDINDSIGHNLGDELLQLVARRIASVVRKGDTLARLGGDEFAVVLERLHEPGEAGEVTQKIIAAFDTPYQVEGHSLKVTCSIGISLFPGDASDATALLRNADLAMYAAKDCGRSTYRYYSQEMNARAIERQTLERALRSALQDGGQFELWYQPKFSFHTGELTGVEALLRWHHPELGTVAPTRFIPIAEETRMILPIGEWVLRNACQQVMAWTRRGHRRLSLAVNVSVAQVNADLPSLVGEILRESGLKADCLEIEITENVLLRDADDNIGILRQLSDLGMTIAIDDFGTGYSSLSYLRRFKLDTIKIDQSFVRNLLNNESDASIVQTIITLAHNLKMIAVAEGVESLDQKNALQAMGCDEWQGYLNCKPLPADEFEKRFLVETTSV